MATQIDDNTLHDAFLKADAAGDTASAQALADEIARRRGIGQYGSGGVEDNGDLQDPNNTGTEESRTADGRLLVNIHGDGDPYQVAGQNDSALAAGARGVGDSVTLGGANRLFAGIQGIDDAIHGGSFTEGYSDTLKRLQDVMHADEANHPIARTVGQVIGGLAIPPGLEGVGLRAGSSVLRSGGSIQEARAAAAVAVRNRMAVVGTGAGATHGYLSSDDLGSLDAAGNAATEGAFGAAGGLALGAAGQALSPRLAERAANLRAAPLTDAQRVMQASDRQGVDVLPADYSGTTVKRLTSGVIQTPFGAGPIVERAQNAVEQSRNVRDEVANGIGQVLNPEAAGEQARAGANSFIRRTSDRGGQLYTAAENGANGVRVTPTQALGVLNRNIRELSETPGGSAALNRLEGLRDALSQGDFTVPGIRNMRTALRDEFTEAGLRGSDVERRVNQVVDAANQDVVAGLRSAGRNDAADAYALADRYWRARLTTIDDHIAPIIGKDGDSSGEQVIKNLQSASKGNNARFSSFLNTLPAEEQRNVRASLISRIGRASSGNQDETGNAFSLQTFLSNWSEIGETAKNRLLGPEGRAAMNDLATIANGARQSQKFANHSNTGGALEANRLLTFVTALPTLGGTAFGQYGMGRMLSSPRFVRWLARAPRTQLSAPAYLDRLSRIARAEPAIANDLFGLQQRLEQVFANGGSAPVAAQDETKRRTEVPQQ